MSYGGEGTEAIGWCRGPTACPLVGPLDTYIPDPSETLRLNPGSQHRIDVEEWGERAQKKHHLAHHKHHHFH